nr:capsid protein [Crow astrovirus]
MESDKPKPQRKRQQKRNKQKNEVDIKVSVKKEKKRNPRVQVTKTTTGLDNPIRLATRSEEQKVLRNLERRLKRFERTQRGPKVQDVMKTTLTLGSVDGNKSGDLERNMRVWFNPCLLKPKDSEGGATPMTIRASQYDLYKVNHVRVVMQPLLGSSVVTGTITFADLDQESSAAKPETIDTIKARPHVSAKIGQYRTWVIPRRYLAGPREGWWYVDTNEDPSQSLGPALNIRTYLKTVNVLGSTEKTNESPLFLGGLFLVELQVTYSFANYNPKPALSSLEAISDSHDAKEPETDGSVFLTNASDGTVVMGVASNSNLYAMNQRNVPASSNTKGQTLWSIASTAVNGVASVLGPWGWLLKGGWWVIRKLFNANAMGLATTMRTRTGKALSVDYYTVYASVEDAKSDTPLCQWLTDIAGNPGSQSSPKKVELPSGWYGVRQINDPNLANPTANAVPVSTGRITPAPLPPEPEPQEPVEWLPLGRMKFYHEPLPSFYTWVPQPFETGPGQIFEGLSDGTSEIKENTNALFSVVGVPKVTKLVLKKAEDPSQPYFGTLQLTARAFDDSSAISIQAPHPNYSPGSSQTGVTDVWYWLDMKVNGILISHYSGETAAYSRQGVMHTAVTLIQAMNEVTSWKDEKYFTRVDPTEFDRTFNYQIYVAAKEVGIDLKDEDQVIMPLATFGDKNIVTLLIINPSQGIFGVLAPSQPWPFSSATINFSTSCLFVGTANVDNNTFDKCKWYQMGLMEEKVVKVPFRPPGSHDDDEDDFVTYKLEELKKLADRLMK